MGTATPADSDEFDDSDTELLTAQLHVHRSKSQVERLTQSNSGTAGDR